MNNTGKILLTTLGLFGFLFLLLTLVAMAFSMVHIRQIEQIQAESFQAVFESQFRSPDVQPALMAALKEKFSADWQIFLRSTPSLEGTGAPTEAGIPDTDLKLKVSTLTQPITLAAAEYLQVLSGEEKLTQVQLPASADQPYRSVYSFPIHSESGEIIGVAQVLWDRSGFIATQRNQLLLALTTILAVLLIGVILLMRIFRRASAPLILLADNSGRISNGEYDLITPVNGDGIQELLAKNLNKISDQMRALVENLDTLVAERTSDLEKRNRQIQTAAQIASQIAAPHHLDDLLLTTANSIHERFAYYHAGIFLVDDLKQYAVLKAATGETGNLLVQAGHKLRIGQSGIVGMVTATGEPRIAADVTQDPAHYRNPILPYTRAEMALPLKAGGEVIGAIDVQSTEIGAFTHEDVSILQTLADHLAVAIENTRLVEKLEASVEETNRLYKRQVEETWRHYTEQTQITGYQYDRMQIMPAETSLPVEVRQKLITGQVVIQNRDEQTAENEGGAAESVLLVPLILREQLIGVIGIEQDLPDHIWTANELAIAQAAANQVSLTLENARLLEETRQRAERERIAGQITARLRESNDPQQILQTAVSELKQALRAQKVQVLIAPRRSKVRETVKTVDETGLPGSQGGNGHGS